MTSYPDRSYRAAVTQAFAPIPPQGRRPGGSLFIRFSIGRSCAMVHSAGSMVYGETTCWSIALPAQGSPFARRAGAPAGRARTKH